MLKLSHMRRAFALVARNEDVKLNHILIKGDSEKPMIVLHGLLGSMKNWRSLVKYKKIISSRRKCYLVEQRNHQHSDHHNEHNYRVMTDDLVRFADSQGLEKFTLLGHSMGGRAAMTMACRFPDRVDGIISVDSAPVDESRRENYFAFTQGVVAFMH